MAIVLKSVSNQDANATPQGAAGLAGFNLKDLAEQGREQIAACHEKCKQLLEQAARDGEQLRAAAKEEGYEEGRREAEQDYQKKVQDEAEAKAKHQLSLLRQGTEQMQAQYQDWMQQYASILSDVALSAAERLVHRSLEHDRHLIVQWAQEALLSTRSAATVSVAVHPETLAELGQALDELLASPEFPEQAHVEADESLGLSDVVIRQSGGEIRAGLNAAIDRLREALA